MKLNEEQQLAVAQALYKRVGEMVSTKNPDSLRNAVDAKYKQLYIDTGAKSFDVNIDGQKVGTYSLRFAKNKPSETVRTFEINDFTALAKWFSDDVDEVEYMRFAALSLKDFAEWYFGDTGELPGGCEIVESVTPETGGEYLGGVLKIDMESMACALEATSPQMAGYLMEGVIDG